MLRFLRTQKAPSPIQIDSASDPTAIPLTATDIRESSVAVSISSTEPPFESEENVVEDDAQIDNPEDG